ncbi:MAG: hypothetical protein HRT38_07240 [Alteromonadaceae bacterium]|nr:hypothetical protein [Alteromonadaceae bacterium]
MFILNPNFGYDDLDFNKDHTVNKTDIALLQEQLGNQVTENVDSRLDLDNDGRITGLDVSLFRQLCQQNRKAHEPNRCSF